MIKRTPCLNTAFYEIEESKSYHILWKLLFLLQGDVRLKSWK
jgi:hypothetical protein